MSEPTLSLWQVHTRNKHNQTMVYWYGSRIAAEKALRRILKDEYRTATEHDTVKYMPFPVRKPDLLEWLNDNVKEQRR